MKSSIYSTNVNKKGLIRHQPFKCSVRPWIGDDQWFLRNLHSIRISNFLIPL